MKKFKQTEGIISFEYINPKTITKNLHNVILEVYNELYIVSIIEKTKIKYIYTSSKSIPCKYTDLLQDENIKLFEVKIIDNKRNILVTSNNLSTNFIKRIVNNQVLEGEKVLFNMVYSTKKIGMDFSTTNLELHLENKTVKLFPLEPQSEYKNATLLIRSVYEIEKPTNKFLFSNNQLLFAQHPTIFSRGEFFMDAKESEMLRIQGRKQGYRFFVVEPVILLKQNNEYETLFEGNQIPSRVLHSILSGQIENGGDIQYKVDKKTQKPLFNIDNNEAIIRQPKMFYSREELINLTEEYCDSAIEEMSVEDFINLKNR